MKVLVTGGAGYIGSHTIKHLLKASYEPLVYDNLSTGTKSAAQNCKLIVGDIADKDLLKKTLAEEKPKAVLHFAGLIDAAKSVEQPQLYLKTNCFDGIGLLETMLTEGVTKIIFSSSAAVYGVAKKIPVSEEAPVLPINPYGLSKLLFEQMMEIYAAKGLSFVSLRYFNAGGTDIEGKLRIGQLAKPDLISTAIRVAAGLQDKLYLYGADYQTKDGTCIRDYVHVDDLAKAHVLALNYLLSGKKSDTINLGAGLGFTNREVIEAVKKISGQDFKVEETSRRPGDPKEMVASVLKAQKILKWAPEYSDLDTIVKTAYRAITK
ncbi:MAG: UDP-glucose 4-epimerase GalE [Actinobacteria bacterium]|nr:MAG: UDP-glucose 4-epimerase GalE [Actinomycetota bacterium]